MLKVGDLIEHINYKKSIGIIYMVIGEYIVENIDDYEIAYKIFWVKEPSEEMYLYNGWNDKKITFFKQHLKKLESYNT